MPSQPIDIQQRQQALNPLTSVCVTAPAGSGKTELLSQRVLTLLARVQKPEEVLAITFTRKAAAEMHSRIMAALKRAADEPEPAEDYLKQTWQLANDALANDKRHDWQLLNNPQRLKVQTIDSFCAYLTQQLPISSKLGVQAAVTEDCSDSYQLAVENVLALLETDSNFADELACLLEHYDNNLQALSNLLVKLLLTRDQWLFHIFLEQHSENPQQGLENTLNTIVTEHLSRLRQKLLVYAGDLIPLLAYAADHLDVEKPGLLPELKGIEGLPDASPENLLLWKALTSCLLTKSGSWAKRLTKSNGFPTETNDGDKKLAKANKEALLALIAEMKKQDGLLQLLTELEFLPAVQYDPQQWQVLHALTKVLPVLVAQLQLAFSENNHIDFTQLSLSALSALGNAMEPSELQLYLDQRISHILIDEYQDTSYIQFKLLERLTEAWPEFNEQNPDAPNTLFIVGDGMQSIYSFRAANVGLFLKIKQFGINDIQLADQPLCVNFRSTPNVVEWNNRVFSQAFPKESDIARGAVNYSNATAFKSDTISRVEVHGCAAAQKDKTLEAEKVVALTQQHFQCNPNGSIAILVRGRNHITEILPALQKAGIDWLATDFDSLDNLSPVRDLLVLTKAMLNQFDRLSWAALMRSPLIGIDNTDLHKLFKHSNKYNSCLDLLSDPELLNQLQESTQLRLSHTLPIIKLAMAGRMRLSLRLWIEGLWQQLGGVLCLKDAANYSLAESYFNLLEQHQKAGRIDDWARFETAMGRLFAKSQSTAANPVQIMTIHKSKGLEFDTVILPGLGRKGANNDKSLLLFKEYNTEQGSTELVMSPLYATAKESDAIYKYLHNEAKYSEELEKTRLLYVATTRAVNNLYLLFSTQNTEKAEDNSFKPTAGSLLTSIWSAVKDEVNWSIVNEEIQQIDLISDNNSDVLQFYRVPASFVLPLLHSNNPLSAYYLERDYHEAENRLLFPNNDDVVESKNAYLGTVLHKVFESIASRSSGSDFWLKLDKSAKKAWLLALSNSLSLPQALQDELIEDVSNTLEKTLKQPMMQWVLKKRNCQANEFPILQLAKGSQRLAIIDRLFVDEDVLWLLDYKTASPADEISEEQFLKAEIQQYQQQLQAYYTALTAILNEANNPLKDWKFSSIKTALYFSALDKLVEVPVYG